MKFEFSNEDQVYQYFREFNATRNSIKRDVQYLKEWMKQEPHLPTIEGKYFNLQFIIFLIIQVNSLLSLELTFLSYILSVTFFYKINVMREIKF